MAIVLFITLFSLTLLMVQGLVLPVDVVAALHLPYWLSLLIAAALLSWVIGD